MARRRFSTKGSRSVRKGSFPRHAAGFPQMESLEQRMLLTVTYVHDVGNIVTNGTNLQREINNAAYGDVIVLDAGATYLCPSGGFLLPYKAGTGTITIQSSALGSLPEGVRVSGDVSRYMPKLVTGGGNAPVIKTQIDASGNPTHGFTLMGLEIMPLNANDSFTTGFVVLGAGSAQDTASKVAHDFLIDRCFVHGLDPISSTLFANYKVGININGANITITNSEVSNIHTQIPDGQAIAGTNGTGNFTITNNFLEGSSECFLYGGGETYIDQNVPSGLVFTNNLLAKRVSWNQYDPHFYDADSPNHGIIWSIKNLFELKNFKNVLMDGNLLDNSWVSGDQTANGVLFTAKNQTSNGQNPWVETSNITMTNNVIRYLGCGIQLAANPATDTGFYGSPAHDITIVNNVFERVDGGTDGPGVGIAMSRGLNPGWNWTVEHNTFYNARNFIGLDSGSTYSTVVSSGLVIKDNVFQYGDRGLMSSAGDNTTALNTYGTGISITNVGSGYTSAPTIQIVGGGGSGATATAKINGTTHVLQGITITNRGSGYTSAPTIQISGGGGSGAAAYFDPAAILNGQLGDWIFTNNLIFGAGTPGTPFPSGNIVPSGASGSLDAIFIRDPAGELNGLLPSSPGHNAASDGTDCGVNPATLAPDFVPLDAAMTGYWKFDEGTGSTVSDSSLPGTHPGTLSSPSLWTTSGQSYNAITLTGGTSGSMSVTGFTTTGTFSFAAWIKPAAVGATSYIGSAGNGAFSLYVNALGKLVATTSNGATVTDSTSLAPGTWYMVGCTYDGSTGTLTLYKNGLSLGTSGAAGAIASGATTLYVGGNGGSSNSFNGSIDEARYYNSDMSALTFNHVPAMEQLYDNYGALLNALSTGTWAGITTTTCTLSVSTAVSHYTYKGSATNLVYTWSEFAGTDQPPGVVTFDSTNGTTAGKSCVATFPGAGMYVLQLDVTDPFGGKDTILRPRVLVIQVPTSASISPSSTSVSTGGTRLFTYTTSGLDQFGDPLTGSWTYAVAAGGVGGVIDASTGLYNAPGTPGSDTIDLMYNGTVYDSATVTVTGAALPSVSVVATDGNAGELWNNPGTYTFTRTGSTASPLTVNFTMSGAATNGVDYQTLGPTVVIPAGAASTTLTLTPIDDPMIEGAESAVLTLTTGAGYAVGSSYVASVSIADSGDVPTIAITATTPGASETGPTNGVFTVTRSGSGPALTNGALAVEYNITGTAANGDDYVTLSHSVIIMPGQTSATITVDTLDDYLMEGAETVIVTLSANSTYAIGSPSTATVTIADNDTVPTVVVSATDPNASEAGPDSGLFTFTRYGPTTSALTVNYSVSGTASTADYTQTLTGSVVIPAGAASTTITITPVDDIIIESDETVVIAISSSANYNIGSPSAATVTIADDDTPVVSLAASDPDASEAGPNDGVFTVTRTGSLLAPLTVYYVVDGTASPADYTQSLTGSVVIPAGMASTTITITPVDDAVFEGSETVILSLASNSGYILAAATQGTVTIADNDLPAVTIVATDSDAREAGQDPGTFTLTRTGTTASSLTVFYSIGGSASASDYTPTLSGSVTFAAASDTAIITITPVDDLLFEGPETLTLTLSTNAAYAIGSPSVGTVYIADNGTPNVTVVASDPSAGESGPDNGVFTVTRTGSLSDPLTVFYTVGGTATPVSDYPALSGSVTIPSGSDSTPIIIRPVDDGLSESNETVIVTLSSNINYVLGSTVTGTVTIYDNGLIAYDGFNYDVAAGARPGPLEGANGGTGFTNAWDVLNNSAWSSINSGSLAYSYAGQTLLTSGNDATTWWQSGVSDASRTISDAGWGTSGTSRWFAFEMNQHMLGTNSYYSQVILDGQIKIGARLSGGYGADILINGNHYYVPGGGANPAADTTFLFVIRVDFGDTVSVPDKVYMWANAMGGTNDSLTPGIIPTDATAVSKTITLPDYLARGTTVPVTVHSDQGNVQATVDEIRFGRNYVDVAPAAYTVPTVTITATDAAAAEEGADPGVFTVTRAGSTAGALVVNYSIGGTASNGADYSTLSGSVTIPDGSASATITVTPIDDSAIEGDETVSLTLLSSVDYVLGDPTVAQVTIADNDALPGGSINLVAIPGSNIISLNWSGSTGQIQGYRVERSRDGGSWSLVQTVASPGTSWVDTERSPVPTYSYRVLAYNASGDSPYSNTVSVQALGVPGDCNNDQQVDVSEYTIWFNNYGIPNPTLSTGDFNGDEQVDVGDYTLWFNNYGDHSGGSAGSGGLAGGTTAVSSELAASAPASSAPAAPAMIDNTATGASLVSADVLAGPQVNTAALAVKDVSDQSAAPRRHIGAAVLRTPAPAQHDGLVDILASLDALTM